MTRRRARRAGYDSGLEKDLHENQLSACLHHPDKIGYIIQKTYQSDFYLETEPYTLIEVKGWFRTYEESSKYIHFIKSNPQYKLVFIFAKPRYPMPGARVRKDGTKLSHGEWATKNGFEWYTLKNIPDKYRK